MAMINKLSILGVRSFDNTRSETILFKPPLTLIVGTNGSGKTTIIECLKYATTGDLPPNAKGGAFIHDPKLCGEKEVLAQVKLGFESTTGARMVCTRNLQLTVKAASRTMKTLEGNMLMAKDGHKTTISTRVAEMDVRYTREVTSGGIVWRVLADPNRHQTQMPQYLGVSKAILDSVIFCHQEESLWPLDTPKELKERFDKIFEALKYTNAIVKINDLKKKQQLELITHKKDEEHTKVIKGKAEQNQTKTQQLYDEIQALRQRSEEKGVQIREKASEAEKLFEEGAKAGLIVAELVGKRIEEQTKEESVQSVRKTLTEMSDSDEDLERMLAQYEERVRLYEDDLERQKVHYGELSDEVKEARKREGAKQRECGLYEAQKESYDRQVEEREKLVKETARNHNVRGFDMEVDDAQVQAFIERISKMARDQNAAFERVRRETQEELQRAQSVLNQINEQKSAFIQRKESARQTISTNDQKIGKLQNDLNNINVDEGGKVAMESNLRETEARLESAKSGIGSANWDSNIETAQAELTQLENRKEKLDAELVEGTRQAGDSARLDFVQKELKDRQRSLDTMTGAHGEKITSTVGQGWTPASVDSDFQRALDQSSAYVTEAEKQRNGTSHEIEQVEYKLNTCRNELKSKRNALKDAEKAIRDAVECEPADYPQEVKQLEQSRDIAKSDAEGAVQLLQYFDACLKDGKDHNACRTCARKFNNAQELERMVNLIEKQRKAYESVDVTKDLADAEQWLKDARAVSTDFDTWERLKQKEIPAKEKEESELSDKRQRLIRQLEEQDAVVSDRQAAKRDVEAMGKTVQNIAKYHAEISNFEEQIKELTAKQKAAGLSRGLESIQEDIAKVNEETKIVRSRREKNTSDRDRSVALINKLQLEYVDIKSKLSDAEHQLKEKKSLEGQIEEYKGLNNEQRESIKSIDQDLQKLVPQLSQAQAKYDDIARRGEEKDRELQVELSKLNNSLSDLRKADQEVKSYNEKGGPQQLARANREFQGLQEEVTRLEQEVAQTVRQVKDLEDQLRNHDETKRSIEDNQRYRRDLRQLQTVRAKIQELESHNAEADKAYYEREGHRLQMERNKFAAQQATMVGSMQTMDNQLKALVEEFEVDYKDAGKKFLEAQIMVQTTKACVEDLTRYGGALDKAIMKYHSLKMEEINRSIEELWRATYQGTDVDTIMIKSESEGGKTTKSYNYRLVMVKQDAEMDMRGRCSAGQKVLASIIIRLALAECFGNSCGMIALDEPTTNLDTENIRALAQSLNKIIKQRRHQPNFQLIVITHDEHFLREMQCGEFAESYWRVSRNAKQKSIIEKQSISAVI